jgi:cell division protein ZapA
LKKCFHIQILGQDLSVLSDSEDEHVANVAEYVRSKVEDIGKSSGNYSHLGIAILAALNIADEYIKLRSVEENIFNQLESRSETLISLINGIK